MTNTRTALHDVALAQLIPANGVLPTPESTLHAEPSQERIWPLSLIALHIVGDEQSTARREVELVVSSAQVVPSQPSASPNRPTALQDPSAGQLTDKSWLISGVASVDQAVPFHEMAIPELTMTPSWPTALQKVGLVQEIPLRTLPVLLASPLHAVPFQARTVPPLPTARQNEPLVQDTALRLVLSAFASTLHVAPSPERTVPQLPTALH